MNILRSSLVLVLCGLVLVSPGFSPLNTSLARADVGPQPVLPGGSSIKPGEETSIQMAAEVVTMTVRQAIEADNALLKLNPKIYGGFSDPVWYPAVAEVEAEFTMRNPTSEAVNINVWFPLASALEKAGWSSNRPGENAPRIESFQVSVDGEPVDYTTLELPNPQGADKPPLPWARFPVTFPSGKDTLIHVSYKLPLKAFPKQPAMRLYYVFQTGAGWAGPIRQADLIVNLPYPASKQTMAELPPGAVLDKNQARWKWINFEPGPRDDFSATLFLPAMWQEMEAARLAVKESPTDGQAWLDLATIYHILAMYWSTFRPYYLKPCIDAYQKAATLLPEHPIPQAALGLFALEPYLENRNAPPEVIQYVRAQYQLARELEEKDPSLIKRAIVTSWDLDNALRVYFYNDATATMDAATQAVYNSTRTAEATINYATITLWAIQKATAVAWMATDMTCWATAGAGCTATIPPTATLTPQPSHTFTPVPSATPQSPPTALPTDSPVVAVASDSSQSLLIVAAAGLVGLVVAGYWLLKRTRGDSGQ